MKIKNCLLCCLVLILPAISVAEKTAVQSSGGADSTSIFQASFFDLGFNADTSYADLQRQIANNTASLSQTELLALQAQARAKYAQDNATTANRAALSAKSRGDQAYSRGSDGRTRAINAQRRADQSYSFAGSANSRAQRSVTTATSSDSRAVAAQSRAAQANARIDALIKQFGDAPFQVSN